MVCAAEQTTAKVKKGRGSPYSITERRVPELIPVISIKIKGSPYLIIEHRVPELIPVLGS